MKGNFIKLQPAYKIGLLSIYGEKKNTDYRRQ